MFRKFFEKFFPEKPDLSNRHGGPRDRGAADYYYWRPADPHKYAEATHQSQRIPLTHEKEIEAYMEGYNTCNDRKDYGV